MKNELGQYNPEELLGGFNKKIWQLYKQCRSLNINDYDADFIDIIKRSYIAELFYSKCMISVSGTQGIGKTTMINNLYNIPNGYLPEVFGRGEKIPVLITENNVDEIKCEVVKININSEGGNFVRRSLSMKEFHDGVRNPNNDEVYYELIVPYNVFCSENYSFVLLPGIENNDTFFDKYNRYVLEQTANTVYLFSSTKMAQMENKKLLQDILVKFKNTKPLFALTFSDQDQNGNIALRDKFIKEFGIKEDQIILVGIDPEGIQLWRDNLIESINKYAIVMRDTREKQLNNIDVLISEDLSKLLNNIESRLILAEDNASHSTDIDRIFRKINKKSAEVEKEVKTYCMEEIKQIKSNAQSSINKVIGDESAFIKTKKIILGKSVKEMDYLGNEVIKAWKSNAQNDVLKYSLEKTNELNTIFYNNYSSDHQHNNNKLNVTDLTLKYFNSTFGNGEMVQSITSISNDRYLENIPFLANELIRMKLIAKSGGQSNSVLGTTNKYDIQEGIDISKELNYASSQRDTIIKGIGLLMGVDVLDGTINTIPAVFSALGIEISAIASSAIFGGIGVGLLALQINKKVNRGELKDREIASAMLDYIGNQYYLEITEKYDYMLGKFYEQLRYRIEDKFNLTQIEAQFFNTKVCLSDVRHYQAIIRENIYDHPFTKK